MVMVAFQRADEQRVENDREDEADADGGPPALPSEHPEPEERQERRGISKPMTPMTATNATMLPTATRTRRPVRVNRSASSVRRAGRPGEAEDGQGRAHQAGQVPGRVRRASQTQVQRSRERRATEGHDGDGRDELGHRARRRRPGLVGGLIRGRGFPVGELISSAQVDLVLVDEVAIVLQRARPLLQQGGTVDLVGGEQPLRVEVLVLLCRERLLERGPQPVEDILRGALGGDDGAGLLHRRRRSRPRRRSGCRPCTTAASRRTSRSG